MWTRSRWLMLLAALLLSVQAGVARADQPTFLEFDDAGSPAIGLVPPGISWEQVHDHIKIAHHHLLVPPDADGEYTGVYWTGREMALVSDLGSDQEEAIEEFRAHLQEHDET